jgi:hypothetical protein
MKKIMNLTGNPSRVLGMGGVLVAFTLLSLSVGCTCPPPPKTPAAIPDSPRHREAANTILQSATAKRSWTDEDDLAFRQNLSHLSVETRLTLAKQLSGLVTSSRLIIRHAPPVETPPPVCQCLAAQCVPVRADNGGGTTTTETPVVDATTPRNDPATAKGEMPAPKKKRY